MKGEALPTSPSGAGLRSLRELVDLGLGMLTDPDQTFRLFWGDHAVPRGLMESRGNLTKRANGFDCGSIENRHRVLKSGLWSDCEAEGIGIGVEELRASPGLNNRLLDLVHDIDRREGALVDLSITGQQGGTAPGYARALDGRNTTEGVEQKPPSSLEAGEWQGATAILGHS
jgi:hypothetical protein